MVIDTLNNFEKASLWKRRTLAQHQIKDTEIDKSFTFTIASQSGIQKQTLYKFDFHININKGLELTHFGVLLSQEII